MGVEVTPRETNISICTFASHATHPIASLLELLDAAQLPGKPGKGSVLKSLSSPELLGTSSYGRGREGRAVPSGGEWGECRHRDTPVWLCPCVTLATCSAALPPAPHLSGL